MPTCRDPDEGDLAEQHGPARMTIPVATRKDFYSGIAATPDDLLPPELREFRHRGDFNLMKVWFDHYRVHYEVVIDQQINKIELGLHFEDGPASSLAFLALLDRRILEIKDHLGPGVELERWTQSWARIYELRPLTAIDDVRHGRLREAIGGDDQHFAADHRRIGHSAGTTRSMRRPGQPSGSRCRSRRIGYLPPASVYRLATASQLTVFHQALR